MMNEKQKKIYRSGLRVINKGTAYDVPGKLIKLARDIESGRLKEVQNIIVAVRETNVNAAGDKKTHSYHFGTGTQDEALVMIKMMEERFMGR